jgi:hypothetical protein
MPPRLTDLQLSEIVRRYQAGEAANSLAPQFGVHVSTLVHHLRRAGVDPTWGVIDQIDVAEAERLYSSGLSLARVGAALGVSAGTVRNLFVRAGAATRGIGTNQWSG